MSKDYDDRSASLLAEIADALLGTNDWKTLERLQAALKPSPPGPLSIDRAGLIGSEPNWQDLVREASTTEELTKIMSAAPVDPEITKSTADMIKSIYSDRIRDQLRAAYPIPGNGSTWGSSATWGEFTSYHSGPKTSG